MIGTADKVVELRDAPLASVESATPVIVSNEYDLFAAYHLRGRDDSLVDTDFAAARDNLAANSIAIIKFPLFHATRFGPPNEEAVKGHPLYKKGLRPHAAYEITNSSWIDELEKLNRVHPFHEKDIFRGYRHFIFSFKDSSLEVVSKNLELMVIEGSMQQAIMEINKHLGC